MLRATVEINIPKPRKHQINAKEAWYVQEKHTPMNYGFSAEAVKRATAVDYTSMAKAVIESEEANRK